MAEDHPVRPDNRFTAPQAGGRALHDSVSSHARPRTTSCGRSTSTGPRAHFEGAYGEVIPKFVVRVHEWPAADHLRRRRPDARFHLRRDTVAGVLLAADVTTDGPIRQHCPRRRGLDQRASPSSCCGLWRASDPNMRPAGLPTCAAITATSAGRAGARLRAVRSNIADGIARYVEWFRATFPDSRAMLAQEQPYNWQPS